MEYTELDIKIPEKKIKQLEKKGYKTVDDIVRAKPLHYCDYRRESSLGSCQSGDRCMFHLRLTKCVKKMGAKAAYVRGTCETLDKKERLSIMWFDRYIYETVNMLVNKEIVVGGEVFCGEKGIQITNPDIFEAYTKDSFRIYPIYSKIPQMSTEYFLKVLNAAIAKYNNVEYLPECITKHFNTVSVKDMIKGLHKPENEEEIKKANYRRIVEKMYPFCKLMVEMSEEATNTDIIPDKLDKTMEIINKLQYKLTVDQKKVLNEFTQKARSGKRVNALVQGDVGSGKTICAILLMMIVVENGYQGVLMAPTGILAKQHYEEIVRLTKDTGINSIFLSSGMKTSEKRNALKLIASGYADIIVGTHSVISDDVKFKKLGIVIVDEEHKFGVQQREQLKKKAEEGVHSISMSATPIPRSLAQTIYADYVDMYTIESMPAGRQPVQTATCRVPKTAFNFMGEEIKKGHQCYVVCPLLTSNDDEDDNENRLYSVEDTYNIAKYYLSNVGAKVAMVTGKMKESEKAELISAFQRNEYQVLVASTVIEVGVNVPNATVITIMNAERFGLAGLHQLRGRVGRSSLKSYCILYSTKSKEENPRLDIMCETTNGFEIAEKDMELRGTGNIVGIEQSGTNEELECMLRYPKLYGELRKIIKEQEEKLRRQK